LAAAAVAFTVAVNRWSCSPSPRFTRRRDSQGSGVFRECPHLP
jgi:hypothetical protein